MNYLSVNIKISEQPVKMLKHSKAQVDANPPQVNFCVTAAAPEAAETLSQVWHLWLSFHKTCHSVSNLISSAGSGRAFAQQLELKHTEDNQLTEIIRPSELQALFAVFTSVVFFFFSIQYLYHNRPW